MVTTNPATDTVRAAVTPSPVPVSSLLAIAGYVGADHGQRLIEALRTLERLHTFRDGVDDPRCRTCRDSRGRPAPFPCPTSLLLHTAMGRHGDGYLIDDEGIVLLRNAGRVLNGQPELPDGGVRRALAPYLNDPRTTTDQPTPGGPGATQDLTDRKESPDG